MAHFGIAKDIFSLVNYKLIIEAIWKLIMK